MQTDMITVGQLCELIDRRTDLIGTALTESTDRRTDLLMDAHICRQIQTNMITMGHHSQS